MHITSDKIYYVNYRILDRLVFECGSPLLGKVVTGCHDAG